MASIRKSYSGPSGKPLPVVPEEEQPEFVPGVEITAPESLDPADSVPPPPPEPVPVPEVRQLPDNTEALAALREREDALTQGANLMKMGEGVNAAFMGREADPTAGKAFTDRITTERTRFNEDLTKQKTDLAQANAADLANPDSDINKQYRMAIRPILGERFVSTMGPAFERLTKEQIEEFMPAVKDRIKFDDAEKQAERQREMDARRLALEEEKARAGIDVDESNALARMIEANRISTTLAESDDSAQEEITERTAGRLIIKLGDDLAKDAGLMQSFVRLERLAPGFTFGKVPKDLPPESVSDWERIKNETLSKFGGRRASGEFIKELSSTVENIKQGIRNDLYGATLTDNEKAAFEKIFDTSLRSGWETQAVALDLFRQQLGAKLNTKLAAFRSTPFKGQLETFLKESNLNNVVNMFTQGINAPLPAKSPGFTPTSRPAGPTPESSLSAPTVTPSPDGPKEGDTRVIQGVTYKRVNGKWKRQ